MNYNDAADGREDLTWQEQGSDYNSDFSLPSDNDNDDEFDEKNESKYAVQVLKMYLVKPVCCTFKAVAHIQDYCQTAPRIAVIALSGCSCYGELCLVLMVVGHHGTVGNFLCILQKSWSSMAIQSIMALWRCCHDAMMTVTGLS